MMNLVWSFTAKKKMSKQKNKFSKGDLIEVTDDIHTPAPAKTMDFVIGFHSFQKSPYNQAWYDVHLADGRTMMMLDNWFQKVDND